MKTKAVVADWNFQFVNEWGDWMPWNIGKMNWRDFTFAHIHFETSRNHKDFNFVLMGLGFYVTWWAPEEVEKYTRMMDEWLKEENNDADV